MVEWLKSLLKRNRKVSMTGRKLQVLQLLSEELNYYEIADALHISHETAKKDIQSIYRELGVHCKEEALQRASALGILGKPLGDGQPESRMLRPLSLAALAGLAILIIILLVSYRDRFLSNPCADYADLTRKKWEQVSASGEISAGPGIVVREANPTEYFGKVESETLTVDLDRCPVLHIGTAQVEPDAGYTIQILDKQSNRAVDIVTDNHSGNWAINLKQAVGWQQPESGTQTFTINIWVSGEGKAVAIDHLSMGPE